MNRREFIKNSTILTSGLLLCPNLVRANPLLGFLGRLAGAVAMEIIVEEVADWIKHKDFYIDFKKSVTSHVQNLNSEGFIPQKKIITSDDYFVFPAINNKLNDYFSGKVPFYCPNISMNSIIDMNNGELRHLSSIAENIKFERIIIDKGIKQTLMPKIILDRQKLQTKKLKYIVYESINNSEIRFESINDNRGFFIIDGPDGKFSKTYNCI